MTRALEVTPQQMALFNNLLAQKNQAEQSLAIAFSAIAAGHGIGDGAKLAGVDTAKNTITVEVPDES